MDGACDTQIASIVSGYCECRIEEIVVIVSRVGCDHELFTCEEKCRHASVNSPDTTSSSSSSSSSTEDQQTATECSDMFTETCPDKTMTLSTHEDSYPLLDMQRVVFTTEGHTFLLWPSLRSRTAENDKRNKHDRKQQKQYRSTRSKKLNHEQRLKRKEKAQRIRRRRRRRQRRTSDTNQCHQPAEAEVVVQEMQQEFEHSNTNSFVERAQQTSDTLAEKKKKERDERRKRMKEIEEEKKKKKKKTGKKLEAEEKEDNVIVAEEDALPPVIVDEILPVDHLEEKSSTIEIGLDVGLDVSLDVGLDALTNAIGHHIAETGGHRFAIECDYTGMCTLGTAAPTIQISRKDWELITVNMYIAQHSENVEDTEEYGADGLDGLDETDEKDGLVETDDDVHSSATSNENINKHPSLSPTTMSKDLALHVHDPDTNMKTDVVSILASPALFGPEIPWNQEDHENYQQELRDMMTTSSDLTSMEQDYLQQEWSPLTVNINMIDGYYYGCNHIDDLDISLKNKYATEGGSGFAMIVYRGQCSFVQKAKVAEWFGSSLVIVIDSDTEGFVENPPKKSMHEINHERSRVDTFFHQLRKGELPNELSKFLLCFFMFLYVSLCFFLSLLVSSCLLESSIKYSVL